jgi:hypothetical protein
MVLAVVAFALLAAPASFGQAAPAGTSKDAREVARRLAAAEQLLRKGEARRGVEGLRALLRASLPADPAGRARDALAAHGYSLHCRVRLREERRFANLRIEVAAVVRRCEELWGELDLFFRQAFPAAHEPGFSILVLDSRAAFRRAFPDRMRRSALVTSGGAAAAAADRGDGARKQDDDPAAGHRIVVFFDSRVANRADAMAIVEENVCREMAAAFLREYTRGVLPEVLATGVPEYLALRLFPDTLTGIPQSQEDLVRSLAREGLGRMAEPEPFAAWLRSASQEGKVSPRVFWQWGASAYAVIDVLLNADIPGTEEDPRFDRPRNRALQGFLREFTALASAGGAGPDERAALLEKLLSRHFDLDLEKLRQVYVRHVGRYPPRSPDYDRYLEF